MNRNTLNGRSTLPVESPTRRYLLKWGIAGGASLLWPGLPALAASATRRERLLVRFRTHPGRIARVLPPPLRTVESAEVQVEYLRLRMGESPESALLGNELLVAGIRLAVEHDGETGWFQPIRWTSNEWLRFWEREHLGFNTKQAEIDFKSDGAVVSASLSRKGFRLNRVQTRQTDRTLGAEELPASRDSFVYRCTPNPDWREPPVREPTGLWRIPADVTNADTLSRVCDVENTKLEWPHASPLDPVAEFPVLEILGVISQQGSATPPPGESRQPRSVAAVNTADFQPWGLHKYDRPVTAKRPWQPEGWHEQATALRLTPRELASYRSREEMRIDQFDMLDMRLTTTGLREEEILPPPCQSGTRPVLRVLVLRVEESDLSPTPFSEAWLLAFCSAGEERGWYALAHICDRGGDLTFGREVLGYPTKTGNVELSLSFAEFAARCVRRGRDVLNASGNIRGIATGTSLSQIPILGLRRADTEAGRRGEIVLQPWYFQGRYFAVDRPSIEVNFPEPGEAPAIFDPWFEFNPLHVASISVMMNGSMQRTPGRVIAVTPAYERYYRERCDGVIPGVDSPDTAPAPTFGVIRKPVTRS